MVGIVVIPGGGIGSRADEVLQEGQAVVFIVRRRWLNPCGGRIRWRYNSSVFFICGCCAVT